MRNGLTNALAAVAFACLGFQAFAVAPVFRTIPSPVVTDDANPVTGSYLFVYADWINLGAYTSDDGSLSNLTWSFESSRNNLSDPVGGIYNLNGGVPLGGGDNPLTPPAGAIISSAANILSSGEYDPDGDPMSVTIRDINLSPFGGPNVTTGTVAGELLHTDLLTLWASDGTVASSSSPFMAFTVSSGGSVNDHLSLTPTPTPDPIASLDFITGINGWTSTVINGASASATGGLCITVPLGGVNIGLWTSPYQQINLAANTAWRLRLTMSTDQANATQVPLWDLLLENLGGAASEQAYIGDSLFLDNVGSANAIKGPAVGRNDFEVWYAVSAVVTPQFNDPATGVIRAGLDADNDMRVIFRVLDTDASSGIQGQLDSGQICLQQLDIDAFDVVTDLATRLNVQTINPITEGTSGVTVFDLLGTLVPGPGNGSNHDFLSNPLTLTPKDPVNGWVVELTSITPGDSLNDVPISDPAFSPAGSADDWPIPWDADTLYELQVEASAPDATAETNGPDSILLGFEAKTTELLSDSYVLTGFPGRPAMPKQVSTVGGTQTYTMYWNSHSRTLSGVAGSERIRWKVLVLNTDAYNRPLFSDVNNHGGIRIHSIKVNKVTFFGM
jgi:hypothetical protein